MSSIKQPVKAARAARSTAAKTNGNSNHGEFKPWNEMIRDLGVVSYNVSDWARAKRFYGETLDLPVASSMDEVGWIEYGHPDQAHLAIMHWRSPSPMPVTGGGTAVFTCPDVRAAVERLTAKGVRCDQPVEVPGVVIYANFYDPDGNSLQLAQSIMQ